MQNDNNNKSYKGILHGARNERRLRHSEKSGEND